VQGTRNCMATCMYILVTNMPLIRVRYSARSKQLLQKSQGTLSSRLHLRLSFCRPTIALFCTGAPKPLKVTKFLLRCIIFICQKLASDKMPC
jgi:hypothetical protein